MLRELARPWLLNNQDLVFKAGDPAIPYLQHCMRDAKEILSTQQEVFLILKNSLFYISSFIFAFILNLLLNFISFFYISYFKILNTYSTKINTFFIKTKVMLLIPGHGTRKPKRVTIPITCEQVDYIARLYYENAIDKLLLVL